MKIIIPLLWIIGFVVFERAAALAKGKVKSRLFEQESFLLEQKICTVIFLLGLISSVVIRSDYLIYLFLVNLIITSLFYLQPTPRTTKKLEIIFILANIMFLAVLLI